MNRPLHPEPPADKSAPPNAAASTTEQADPEPDDPALQGEGNYTAARRHHESLKDFVDSGQVEQAAHDAAPDSPGEAREMQDAEAEGRAHAKR